MLVLSPQIIGDPHWEPLQIGDIPGALDQYYRIDRLGHKAWTVSPFTAKDPFIVRIESPNYRRPVTLWGKTKAVWAAKGKLVKLALGLKI